MEIDRVVGGVRHPFITSDEILESMKSFEVREDDIWVITFPKAGTTWMCEIISILYHGCDFAKADEIPIQQRFTFLDIQDPNKNTKIPSVIAASKPSPRFLKTHLPSHQMASQIPTKKPKIVFVARNIKDNAVSLFHFHQSVPGLRTYDSWDQFLEAFFANDIHGGSWFDINLYWWNRRHDENVLFVKYEDMKKDLGSVVMTVAEFFGWTIPDGKLEEVVKHCSFDSMKSNPKTNQQQLNKISSGGFKFMRKGDVGDWKNYFSVSQNQQMDEICEEKLNGTGLKFEYEI